MANIQISQLPAAGSPDDAYETPIQTAGVGSPTEKLTLLQIFNWILSKVGTFTNKSIDGISNVVTNMRHGIEVDSPTTGVHGVGAGSVVGTTLSQTLTNKKIGDQLDYVGVGSEPSSPASGELRVYAKSLANRMLPKWKGPSGLDTYYQAGLFGNMVAMLLPSSGTAVTAWGLPNTAVGTISHPALASTNLKTSMRRILVTSATTANSASELRSAVTLCWRGNAAGLGGFFASWRFTINSVTANQQLFVGLMSTTGATATTAVPSNLTNIIGIGWDAADTNLQIMHNDASGTATKIDLGANFPTNTTSAVYELTLFAPPNDSNVYYRVKRLDTGDEAEGTISTNIPGNTTFLTRHEYMNNGGTAASVVLEVMRVYLESDY